MSIHLDYGFLNKEELEEVMDMDETYINTLIKKDNSLKFSELKKWELEAILEQEEEEKKYLETFLQDYRDIKINEHLFSDMEDLLLTKLDNVFDSMIYDSELFNFDFLRNLEIYAFSQLMLLFVSVFCAFFNNEIYNNVYVFDENRNAVKPSVWDELFFVAFILSSFMAILKSASLSSMVQNHSKGTYFSLKIVVDLLVVLIISSFTEPQSSIPSTQIIAFLLVSFG